VEIEKALKNHVIILLKNALKIMEDIFVKI